MALDPQRRKEYQDLFNSCETTPSKTTDVQSIVGRILSKKDRYQAVEDKTGVPWFIVAVIHSLEGDLNFSTHLHNGDSLNQKTVHIPKGRPDGNPPFTWIDSAADALDFDGLTFKRNWALAGSLDALEGFNGVGYRRPDIDIPSPYLWSFSNHYTKGKFGSDGHFNKDLVSEQCGAAVLLKFMVDAGHMTFPSGMATDAPLGVKVTAADAVYPGHVVTENETNKDVVKTLQKRLNDLGCGPIDVDGVFGEQTKNATMLFQTRHTDVFGHDLEVDGEVGSLTWAALFGDSTVPEILAHPSSDLLTEVIAFAATQVGVMEKPPGSNAGPEVEQYQASVGLRKGDPWCAAFEFFCFAKASERLNRANPMIQTGGVLDHWDRARKKDIPVVLATDAKENPELVKPGMLFIMSTGGGNGHTGIVEKVIGGRLVTIEGNTSDGGSREGIGVFRRDARKIFSINKGFIDYGSA
jgi:lysozyme family protein